MLSIHPHGSKEISGEAIPAFTGGLAYLAASAGNFSSDTAPVAVAVLSAVLSRVAISIATFALDRMNASGPRHSLSCSVECVAGCAVAAARGSK